MSVTMSLAGTFDGNDFAEVLELLSRRACTGKFQVRGPSLNAAIRLLEGQAVGVDIVVAGWRDGRRDLRGELEEVCLHALRSARGTFEFQPSEEIEPGDEQPVKLGTVMGAAKRRLAAWQEVEAVVPSLSVLPRLSEELGVDKLTVTQDQWRVIAAVDGRRSVSGLARRLELEPLHLCQLLEPLVRDGAIEIASSEARPRATTDVPRPSIDPIPGPDWHLAEASGHPDLNGVTDRSGPEIPAFRVVSRAAKPALGPAPAG